MSFPAGIAVVYACHPMPFPMPKNISSPAFRMYFAGNPYVLRHHFCPKRYPKNIL